MSVTGFTLVKSTQLTSILTKGGKTFIFIDRLVTSLWSSKSSETAPLTHGRRHKWRIGSKLYKWNCKKKKSDLF